MLFLPARLSVHQGKPRYILPTLQHSKCTCAALPCLADLSLPFCFVLCLLLVTELGWCCCCACETGKSAWISPLVSPWILHSSLLCKLSAAAVQYVESWFNELLNITPFVTGPNAQSAVCVQRACRLFGSSACLQCVARSWSTIPKGCLVFPAPCLLPCMQAAEPAC